MRRDARLAAVLCTPLLLLPSACGGGDGPGVKVEGEFGRRPTVTIPSSKPDGKFASRTVIKGKGPQVHKGDLVIADYAGYSWNDSANKLIASSYAGGDTPAAFPSWQLVPGLEKAMIGAKVGSRVVTVIPPKDGYGDKGAPQLQITGRDSLVYVLDLVATFPKESGVKGTTRPLNDARLPQVGAARAGQAPPVTVPKIAPPARLQVRTVIQGTGAPVKRGQVLALQYAGYLWRDGRSFDSSYAAGHPFSTVIGARQVLQGWDQGLIGQKVGSRALLVVPPAQGYGAKGLKQSGIKGSDTLVYVVDILGAY
ncbi:FKBP-type peptidyl-prolyl cis-trans isomerase [Actinomadura scrupuli]|uniref:FKBP-type peptidyl-prolyl cis-trans isomerase n=1 Tax=Actinomadura scrupuli TaxID=559629 RepID=UPI003D9717F2